SRLSPLLQRADSPPAGVVHASTRTLFAQATNDVVPITSTHHSRAGGNDGQVEPFASGDSVELVASLRRLMRSRGVIATGESRPSPLLHKAATRNAGAAKAAILEPSSLPLPGAEISPGLRLIEQQVPLLPASRTLTVRSLWPLLSRGLPHCV